MIKKNQVMITALAIMIAVAGYLNFAGTKVTDEEIMTVNGGIATDDLGNLSLAEEDIDYSALLDISDEDIEQASADIPSLD
ncbi:MAG: SpoIIIAH-like family protein, partial [Lachnospiraceae bacterium]|nr:SpoIIIAH-like family protein [Lachnospiraceae bacterium]